MNAPTVQEPLRDRVGRAIYEIPNTGADWYSLSEERREPWRQDADRAIAVMEQADAELIAAAPDMLAALLVIVDGSHDIEGGLLEEHEKMARDAIAKATGGA